MSKLGDEVRDVAKDAARELANEAGREVATSLLRAIFDGAARKRNGLVRRFRAWYGGKLIK